MKNKYLSGKKLGLTVCLDCHLIIKLPSPSEKVKCPRCGAKVSVRKPESLAYTWALVITALILYFPANILPIMQVDFMGVKESSTIMDGIIYFFREGSYGIGIIILTASILVPVFKIIGIMMVLLSVQFRWQSWLKHKMLMFRFIKFIGKWSMLDVFVVALLMSEVKFGFFSTVEAGPGASFFCAVVVATMLAATRFDTRLLWDT